ncbi:hypothetical protein [Actinoplanes rectilineatus]|uniref:hypothetical protein n=1 Tax=Actinoplanes rectilineatus TaxID=113571 RepID=UPI000695E822|nr:hypothetical protein [Actinoplanes rectilineatus]
MLYALLDNAIRNTPDRVWDRIAPVLEDLAEGRTSLDAVRHPLGFVCLPLVRDDSPEGVCLHYWSTDEKSAGPTTSRYHCHSWHLLSHILAGSVGNQRITLVPGDRFREFTALTRGYEDTLEPTAVFTDVRCDEPETYAAGESYELEAGHFHASVSSGATVSVTLVLGRMVPGETDITLGTPALGPHRVIRRSLGHQEARRVAGEVLRLRPALSGSVA